MIWFLTDSKVSAPGSMTRHDTIVAGACFATDCLPAFVFSRGRTHRHCRFSGIGAGCPTDGAGFGTRQPVRFKFDQSERYKFGG